MENKPIRLVQISDLHLFADKKQSLLGVTTYESFKAVVELLKQDAKQPSLIIISGDISQDYTKESYLYLAAFLKDFPVPVYYVPGNHDDHDAITSVYPCENISDKKQIVFDHWQIILLNSQKNGAVYGWLDATELTFLETCLKQFPDHYSLVVFHHHPVPVNSAWLDNLGLRNADELWKLLNKKTTILFGHVHQEHVGAKNGVDYFSTPSTCIQFKRNSDEFALEKLGPGYRWVELYDNGKMETGVTRLDHYVGEFDHEAKGY